MKTNLLSLIKWFCQELVAIRKSMENNNSKTFGISPDWLKWKDVMAFFDYKDTQMAEMAKEHDLTVAQVGRRKFIHRSSIANLLEKNIISGGTSPNETNNTQCK